MPNPMIGQGWSFPPQIDEHGTLELVSDDEEIEQSIRVILMTAPGQRVMRPEFGCRIHELIFHPNNASTAGLASRYVREALGRWEPRIDVQAVDVDPDETDPSRMLIRIQYRVSGTYNSRTLVYPFYVIPAETVPARAEELVE